MEQKDVTFQELREELVQHLVCLPDNDPALFLRTWTGVKNQKLPGVPSRTGSFPSLPCFSQQQPSLRGIYLPVLGSSVPPALLGGVHLPAGLQAPARERQPLEWPRVLPSDSGQPVPGLERPRDRLVPGNRQL